MNPRANHSRTKAGVPTLSYSIEQRATNSRTRAGYAAPSHEATEGTPRLGNNPKNKLETSFSVGSVRQVSHILFWQGGTEEGLGVVMMVGLVGSLGAEGGRRPTGAPSGKFSQFARWQEGGRDRGAGPCPCSVCGPKGCRPHGATGRPRGSGRCCHRGTPRRPACAAGSPA